MTPAVRGYVEHTIVATHSQLDELVDGYTFPDRYVCRLHFLKSFLPTRVEARPAGPERWLALHRLERMRCVSGDFFE